MGYAEYKEKERELEKKLLSSISRHSGSDGNGQTDGQRSVEVVFPWRQLSMEDVSLFSLMEDSCCRPVAHPGRPPPPIRPRLTPYWALKGEIFAKFVKRKVVFC